MTATDTRQTLDAFIATERIAMTAERTDSNPNMDNSREMDHWKVTLRRAGRRMTLVFSMGYGHNGKAPTTADVLNCLASDASSADQDFEDWASDLGYDTDSRKAERTYRAVTKSAQKLKTLLGPDAFDALQNCERL